MKREVAEFPIPENLPESLLAISTGYDPVVILNSNRKEQLSDDCYASYDLLAALGSISIMKNAHTCFQSLDSFLKEQHDWTFGFFTYDLKNEIEKLESTNTDNNQFPDFHFFQPRYVLAVPIGENKLFVHYHPLHDTASTVKEFFSSLTTTTHSPIGSNKLKISARVSKVEYVERVNQIKQHIQRGDVYEMNYCQEFYSENVAIYPQSTYLRLNELSPMPFSCFYKTGEQYLLCASPERFLKRSGHKIISQPIKGTIRRGNTKEEDNLLMSQLKLSEKERSENVMIVDLVRNDLSRTASRGSVKVEELFGIYPFRSLHQMISTIISEVKDETSSTDVIRYAFPMGSMTGAPKVRAMQLIEDFEQTKRGLYSGSVGYFTPDGNFDLNVVIRSILYSENRKYVSFTVGSAITTGSDPEQEYEECMLKAKTMMKVFDD